MTEPVLLIEGGGTILIVGIIIGFLGNMILNKIRGVKTEKPVIQEIFQVPVMAAVQAPAYAGDNAHIAAISAALAEYRKNN